VCRVSRLFAGTEFRNLVWHDVYAVIIRAVVAESAGPAADDRQPGTPGAARSLKRSQSSHMATQSEELAVGMGLNKPDEACIVASDATIPTGPSHRRKCQI
jgi:hypothetical protein